MIAILMIGCTGLLAIYGLLLYKSMFHFKQFVSNRLEDRWPHSAGAYTAPRAQLGSSMIERKLHPVTTATRPIEFHALRASEVPLGNGRWQLRIRALLLNNTDNEIVFDDLHSIVYVRLVPTPPLMTVSYHGNAIVVQDNTLFKEHRVYSMKPGDGFEIDVLLQVTRYEGAPAYYGMREEPGPICIVFGLIGDFYDTQLIHGVRSAVTSDAIFMFMCRSKNDEPTLTKITKDNADTIPWPPKDYAILDPLPVTLEKHQTYRPTPRR